MTYWSNLPYAIQILDLIRSCSHAPKLGVATLGSHVSKEGKSEAWEHSERQLGFLHVDQPQIMVN